MSLHLTPALRLSQWFSETKSVESDLEVVELNQISKQDSSMVLFLLSKLQHLQ